MDGTRFDTVARNLSATGTRRGMLRTMAVAGLGLGLSGIGLSEALAKGKKRKKKNKGYGKKDVTDLCRKTKECSGHLVCKVANSQHYYDETEKRCCIEDGDPCDYGYECCGVDVICNGGYCQGA